MFDVQLFSRTNAIRLKIFLFQNPILTAANSLKPGDCVLETEGNYLHPVKIYTIYNIIQKGIFAPLTDHGDVIFLKLKPKNNI